MRLWTRLAVVLDVSLSSFTLALLHKPTQRAVSGEAGSREEEMLSPSAVLSRCSHSIGSGQEVKVCIMKLTFSLVTLWGWDTPGVCVMLWNCSDCTMFVFLTSGRPLLANCGAAETGKTHLSSSSSLNLIHVTKHEWNVSTEYIITWF